jgi:hypothetical protein
MRKELEGSGCGLNYGTLLAFGWGTEENRGNPQLG